MTGDPPTVWAARARRWFERLEAAAAWSGRLAGWLLPVMIAAVLLTILAGQLRMNYFAQWDSRVPLFGRHLSVNGLVDLQWHLFAVLVMLGGAFALRENAHVTVDFLALRFAPRTRRLVVAIGDLLLLLPFCAVMVWFSWRFTMTSFNTGEGSTHGGLIDRYLVKMFLPIGFSLLFLSGVGRIGANLIAVLVPSVAPPDDRRPTLAATDAATTTTTTTDRRPS